MAARLNLIPHQGYKAPLGSAPAYLFDLISHYFPPPLLIHYIPVTLASSLLLRPVKIIPVSGLDLLFLLGMHLT